MNEIYLKRIKAVITLIMLIFLGVSTYFLMGDEKQMPIQMGFGLGYLTYALFSINKRIDFIEGRQVPKIRLERLKKNINFFAKGYALIFGLFSTFIFLLANKGIVNTFMSSLWLVGLIIFFQGCCFIYLFNFIGKNKVKTLKTIFNTIYAVLSVIFGWASAQLAFFILKLPAREDLFFATYGLLILPIAFLIYFDYFFDYKSNDSHIITDLKYLNK